MLLQLHMCCTPYLAVLVVDRLASRVALQSPALWGYDGQPRHYIWQAFLDQLLKVRLDIDNLLLVHPPWLQEVGALAVLWELASFRCLFTTLGGGMFPSGTTHLGHFCNRNQIELPNATYHNLHTF